VAGRHRGSGVRSLRAPIAVAGAVVLLAGAVVTVRAVAADADGCTSDVQLTVAVTPDLEPAVREVADRWTRTNPKVDGVCVGVRVRAAASADVANLLATRANGTINVAAAPVPMPKDEDVPAVWIPDSTAWLLRVKAVDQDALDGDARSTAMSPVVLAVPEGLAKSLPANGNPVPSVLGLATAGSVRLGAAEPRRDTAGLAGAALLRDAIVTDPSKLVDLVRAYRAIGVAAGPDALLQSFAAESGDRQIAPMSEQAVVTFDRASPAVPLAAVPTEPGVALDYPYSKVSGKSPATGRAADLFAARLRADESRDVFLQRGFRNPDGSAGSGFPAGHGVSTDRVPAQPFADPARITDVLGLWTATKSPSRVLTLFDVTASTAQPIVTRAGPTTRFEVLRRTAVDGLKLFTDDSELGLWAFGSGPKEAVPIGPLDAAQRARLTTAIDAAAPVASDVSGLYESVLAAYKTMRDGYREGRSNTVVVFTDGANSKPGMSLEAFEEELEKATDPTKAVRVVLLGLGPNVDMTELTDIARRTGGRAFAVEDPDQIGAIFLQALLRTG
jgi:hypothetical protein